MPSFFSDLADDLLDLLPPGRRLVALDGVDGSGKTTFVAALAAAIAPRRPVLVVHADDFLRPAAVRHSLGRASPEGFWLHSYDHVSLADCVLDPMGVDGDGWFVSRAFDPGADRAVERVREPSAPETVTIVEGLFLHRRELRGRWDASVFLDVPFEVSVGRLHVRDGTPPDPQHPAMRRYVGGQRLYFADSRPWERATVVVDNSDAEAPRRTTPAATAGAGTLAGS